MQVMVQGTCDEYQMWGSLLFIAPMWFYSPCSGVCSFSLSRNYLSFTFYFCESKYHFVVKTFCIFLSFSHVKTFSQSFSTCIFLGLCSRHLCKTVCKIIAVFSMAQFKSAFSIQLVSCQVQCYPFSSAPDIFGIYQQSLACK